MCERQTSGKVRTRFSGLYKKVMSENGSIFSIVTGLRNILPITTAKVPIVKFEHRQSGLEGDISLYNTLVSEQGFHTRMLRVY